MKKTLVFIAALLIAAPAMASISVSWTVTEDSGMCKIVGTLTSTGGNIDAIDCGTPSDPGIEGPMYQDWLYGAVPTPAATTVAGASPAVDTHFLFDISDLTVPAGRELAEDNDLSSDPTGCGTYLGGTFGIAPAVQDTELDFVQIYCCSCQDEISYYMEVSEAGVPKSILEGTVKCPEPATMALLGVGGLALLRRRRK